MVSIKSSSVAQDKKLFFEAANRLQADLQTMVDVVKNARDEGRDTSWVPGHWWNIIKPMVLGKCSVGTFILCAGIPEVAEAIDALDEEHRFSVLSGGGIRVYDPQGKNGESVLMQPKEVSPALARQVFDKKRIRTIEEQKRKHAERQSHPERDDMLDVEGVVVKKGTLYVRTNAGTAAVKITKAFCKMIAAGLEC